MLKSVHLVGEGESDGLYADFDDDYNPAFDTEELYGDEGFQQALKSSYGKRPTTTVTGRPGTGQRLGTSLLNRGLKSGAVNGVRPVTGVAADPSLARPMTAVRAAGYSSVGNRAGAAVFDPLNQARGPAPPLEGKTEGSPDEKARLLEQRVIELVEESCFALERGENLLCLEKAKDAGRKERELCRKREQSGLGEQINLDITYSVLFNLASAYHWNQMYSEAINTYGVIVKNKMFSNAGRLRVNIGNVYYDQRKYSQAIKNYRMALDQIPNSHKEIRIKIMKNIANVFVKMGQYTDASTTFEHIMQDRPDIETGLNLLLCCYAAGDKEKMKKTFQKLTQVDLRIDEDRYNLSIEDHKQQLLLEVIRDDLLRRWEKSKRSMAEKSILLSAKLIAPVIDQTFDEGFDWCIDCVKGSPYLEMANELDITRSIEYLKMRDFSKAVETLKRFEKKDSKMQSQAAVNLSFLYFLEGDLTQADKHAEIAMNADRYNPAALVNKGCCVMRNGDTNKATEYFLEALSIEASCTEALYNLGICYKQMKKYDQALDCFHKFHAIVPNYGEVMYQLASLYELSANHNEALEWYHQLLTLVPTDSSVLTKLAELYYEENDKSQAFQYNYEAFRYNPSDIDTIKWLGCYYVDAQFVEKAIVYFERAILAQPLEVKWQLMLATCFRKAGNYSRATETYKQIHARFPDNIECLKFLIRIYEDQGLQADAARYRDLLTKVQKSKDVKEQRAASGGRQSGKRSSASAEKAAIVTGGVDPANEQEANPSLAKTFPGAVRSKQIDASYADPFADLPDRPKTTAGTGRKIDADDFDNEDIGDDLLPD